MCTVYMYVAVCPLISTAVNTFLLIATNKSINYVPVPVDGSSTTSRRLSIGPVGNIQAMAYDPANKSVLWIDNITNTIQSVAINGSAQWEYSVPSGIETFSMAYDWFGGQVFVTETSGFQIELLTLNGESLGSLLKLADNPHHLQKPREVVIDDENRFVHVGECVHITVHHRILGILSASATIVVGSSSRELISGRVKWSKAKVWSVKILTPVVDGSTGAYVLPPPIIMHALMQ